jgi:Tfp pilus assembly protein PilN
VERIELNLIPIEHRISKRDHTWILDKRVIIPSVIILVELLVCAIIGITVSETSRRLENEIDSITAQIQQQAPIQKEIQILTESLDKKKRKNRALKSIEVSKKRWIEIFEDLSTILPGNMWIYSLEQDKNLSNQITFIGMTYNFSEISQYMLEIEQQRSFNKLLLKEIITITMNGNTVYRFTMICMLKDNME